MGFNFSLRNKFLFTYGILFLAFIVLMHSFATYAVKAVVIESMEDRTSLLLHEIQSQKAADDEELIRYLKDLKPLIFFRVSIINDKKQILYDSHTKRLLGSEFDNEYTVEHQEVLEALKKGTGYHEDYSAILGQEFAYFAKTFEFHHKTYVMRTAFPLTYVDEVSQKFETTFLLFAAASAVLVMLMVWITVGRLTSPINQIITAIKPYQEGKEKMIPEIKLNTSYNNDEIGRLAGTLNSLSFKIQRQINHLTEEKNEKLSILESLTEGVIAVDANLKVEYANQMALKLLDFGQVDIIGSQITSEKYPVSYNLCIQAIEDQEIKTTSLEHKLEGRKMFIDLIVIPRTGSLGAIIVLQDKTQAYKLLQMRRDFVANASHELKTPITIIQGFAEALHDNPDLEQKRRNEITQKIVTNCERLTHLIKNLLALSDTENLPATRLSHVDLGELCEEYRLLLLERYPQSTVTIIKNQDLIELTLDEDLFQVAMINLLENAAKYSNPPADITVTIDQKNNHAIIIVSDKGIGIPEADLEHIFQKFYTVNKTHSRKMGGSGLGLSIVETIIEKHFGKISVASKLGVGTTFIIEIPLHRK